MRGRAFQLLPRARQLVGSMILWQCNAASHSTSVWLAGRSVVDDRGIVLQSYHSNCSNVINGSVVVHVH